MPTNPATGQMLQPGDPGYIPLKSDVGYIPPKSGYTGYTDQKGNDTIQGSPYNTQFGTSNTAQPAGLIGAAKEYGDHGNVIGRLNCIIAIPSLY